jgi:pantetheine-phosphate adenylyltransferase
MQTPIVKAVYPGSFDPITNGHLDIIERSAQLFPMVIVGVLDNPNKKPLFTVKERVEFIEAAISGLSNVKVLFFSGLLIDFARQVQANLIVRGLRAITDFEIEFQMALNNKRMAPEIETMFMMTKNEYSFLSSSMVKELAQFHADIRELAPEAAVYALEKKFAEN